MSKRGLSKRTPRVHTMGLEYNRGKLPNEKNWIPRATHMTQSKVDLPSPTISLDYVVPITQSFAERIYALDQEFAKVGIPYFATQDWKANQFRILVPAFFEVSANEIIDRLAPLRPRHA